MDNKRWSKTSRLLSRRARSLDSRKVKLNRRNIIDSLTSNNLLFNNQLFLPRSPRFKVLPRKRNRSPRTLIHSRSNSLRPLPRRRKLTRHLPRNKPKKRRSLRSFKSKRRPESQLSKRLRWLSPLPRLRKPRSRSKRS